MDYRRAWAEIDINCLIHNVQALRGVIPKKTQLMAVVKADAYGHGSVEVARTLLENGADVLGVALCEEGIKLRKHGITAPILVMSYTPEPLFEAAVLHGLTLTVFSAESYMALAKAAAQQDKKAEVHIKIDTGMGRLGFLPGSDAADKICEILEQPALQITGIYTHFATSDAIDASFMYEQYARFQHMIDILAQRSVPVESWIKHVGNCGMLSQTLREDFIAPDFDMFMDMVRIGIMLYGLPPSSEMSPVCDALGLKPVMSLKARISMTKTLPPGSGVSYGHLFRTERETLVATLPIGYADGYPRLLSNKGKILINGRTAPIIGAICMDQCMVDVTDVPDAQSIKCGEIVTMFGGQGPSAEDLAAQIGTIGYELLCGIGKRVPRVYLS
ncbi:MAG: alanine racemase [Defluviitaleaceae bacterium]|nr:alanine racemase [Defluviitaleaceae bacterium]